ncbi:hypothetical protein PIROE2DRAFT_13962 [Piromyces sp. E2]|nr:hypothetical protein PIROE2DRAFT_13962 [Piromyces sp. E2]|eukprot:OUM60305.1 hypothetical protein PIROE2DRAFT_13962 [Piromyces sp. E2]
MYSLSLLYLFCVSLFFTSIYGITYTKEEVLKRTDNNVYYCKDNICVSSSEYRTDYETIIIPNNQGRNVTYITDSCSSRDIDIGACNSKECSNDSQCLSNKCIKGHCIYNEDNPVVECQYVRTRHNAYPFGDPKGYKMQCGLPYGYECKSNDGCSSYNCNNGVCGTEDDSGCHSTCGIGQSIVFAYGVVPLVILFILISCCICCSRYHNKNKKEVTIV